MTRTAPRRELLLEAAADLFAARGYFAVGIDDIGAAAGITGPGVYRHFASKQALLVALCERTMERMLGLAGAADSIESLVTVHVTYAVEEREQLGVWVRERHALTETDRRRLRGQQQDYVDIWRAALAPRRPDLDADEIALCASSVLAMLNATSLIPSPLPKAQRAAVLSRLALSALLGHA